MHIGYTQILDRTYPGPQGPQALATRLINITEGVIEGFGRFIREHPHPMPVTVVSDPNTHQAAEEEKQRLFRKSQAVTRLKMAGKRISMGAGLMMMKITRK